MKVGIVATIERWSADVEHWVAYHRAIGIDRLFVYLDDPAEPAPDRAGVTATACDRARWQRVRDRPEYAVLAPDRDYGAAAWHQPASITLRQLLNVDDGLERAREHELDWLLHIDADELFHPRGVDVHDHFAELAWQGVACASYVNAEAAVPPELHDERYFLALTAFKRNPRALSPPQLRKLARLVPAGTYFLAYDNGKSAVRVTPGVRPHGVHSFETPPGGERRWVLDGPEILHYPYSSYARFAAKHERLGMFDPSSLLGERWNPPLLVELAQGCVARGDRDGLRELYERRVVLPPVTRELLGRAGIVADIVEPSRVLAALTA